MNPRTIRFNLVIAIVFSTLTLGACSKDKPGTAEPEETATTASSTNLPVVVSAETVSEYSPPGNSSYSAVIQPYEEVSVAFKASGYVQSIYKVRGEDGTMRNVQDGDFVRRGTELARVDQSDNVAKVSEQKAALEEAQVSQARSVAANKEAEIALEQARTEYERTARLFQAESATKPDLDAAKSRLDIAAARVDGAKAQIEANKAGEARNRASLEQARLNLKDCTVKAPIDGIVLKRLLEEGSLASQGATAFTLARANPVKVSFGVPDLEVNKLKLGQIVQVTAEAVPDKVYQGKITEVSATADAKTRVFNVEVSLPNPDARLKLGMVASLSLSEKPKLNAGLTVPLTAVVRSTSKPEGYAVYVVEEAEGKTRAAERQVVLGDTYDRFVAINQGVKAGERVITNGSARVTTGQEIRLQDEIVQ